MAHTSQAHYAWMCVQLTSWSGRFVVRTSERTSCRPTELKAFGICCRENHWRFGEVNTTTSSTTLSLLANYPYFSFFVTFFCILQLRSYAKSGFSGNKLELTKNLIRYPEAPFGVLQKRQYSLLQAKWWHMNSRAHLDPAAKATWPFEPPYFMHWHDSHVHNTCASTKVFKKFVYKTHQLRCEHFVA